MRQEIFTTAIYAGVNTVATLITDELLVKLLQTSDRPAYKIEISRDRSKLIVSQVTLLNSAQRVFTTRRYLLPISQDFLNTREAYGIMDAQNEGW